jgi:nucleoside-diphosphate-sugar epimerase
VRLAEASPTLAECEAPLALPALVTGASGFLGRNLVRRLLADGVSTRALARSPAKAELLEEQGAEAVVGDITDEEALDRALDGVGTVFHLAGRLLVPGLPAQEYRSTHVVGTQRLLAHCRGRSGLTRFVHCSTTGVVGVTGETPADEDAPLSPRNVYEETKAEAEVAVRASLQEGIPAVIVRPGLVYGPGDFHLLGFFRAVLRGRFRPIGRADVYFHPVYADDLTEALVRCGNWPLAVGECFNIAGREPVTLAELAETIARAAGASPPHGTIPLSLARAAASLGDLLPGRVRRFAPLTASRVEFLTNSRIYDVTKARLLLDFTAPTDLETGIRQTLAWYHEHGHLPRAKGRRNPEEAVCESATT